MIETTDPIELLRAFRAEVPEATAAETEAALVRLSHARPRRRRSRLAVVSLGGAAAAAVAAAVVAAAPWHSSTQGPSATYKPGWIVHRITVAHEVPYPGAGRYARLVDEDWRSSAAPYKFRSIGYNYAPWTEKRVEVGAQNIGNGSEWFSYDPKSAAIYRRLTDAPLSAPVNPQAYNRSKITSGGWKVAATVTIGGKRLLEVENVVPGWTYYIDAETYSLVRRVGTGYPLDGRAVRFPCTFSGPMSKAVIEEKTEYLPPTDANMKLLDVQVQHPNASLRPESAMPVGFRQIRYPPQCLKRPIGR